MDDLTKAAIGVGTVVVLAAIGGGTMGKAVISSFKQLLEAALKNMEANTETIQENTKVSLALVNQINTFIQVQGEKDKYIHERLIVVERAAIASKEAATKLVEKLDRRL